MVRLLSVLHLLTGAMAREARVEWAVYCGTACSVKGGLMAGDHSYIVDIHAIDGDLETLEFGTEPESEIFAAEFNLAEAAEPKGYLAIARVAELVH